MELRVSPSMPIHADLSTLLILFAIILFRYLIFAGGAYAICWVWLRDSWRHKRIQLEYPPLSQIYAEIRWSVVSSLIFAVAGLAILYAWQRDWTLIYVEFSKFGAGYFLLSIGLFAFAHETYFYWTHRWMHQARWYRRIHKVHHDSRNPSPWAAFSFHPYEAMIEAIILPFLVLVIPVHPAALLLLLTAMTLLSVINHLGYELYPATFARHRVWRGVISATHHQMHHRNLTCNFGLYFTFWDKLMKTHDARYLTYFDEVQQRGRQTG